ncbi:MAG: hypothetical protein ABSH11_01835 [Verrucomicrobiota bacterium]|jgi:hypothetical protein
MKPWIKKQLVTLVVLLSIFVAGRLVWPLLPVSIRVKAIRAEYSVTDDWYPTYNQLGNMLKLGMTTEEVGAILGAPDIQEAVAGGKRWNYCEVGPTSGGGCVVDFSPDGNAFRLCYFVNYEHLVFRDSSHREFGNPVDGGRFEGNPGLKMRWNEWYGKKRPTP